MTSNISRGLEKLKEDGRNQGKIEGKTEILIKQLSRKLKTLPQKYIDKIKSLPEGSIENIATDIFDIETIEDLKKYL